MSDVRTTQGRSQAAADFDGFTDNIERELLSTSTRVRTGKVVEVVGTLVKVAGLDASLGEQCELTNPASPEVQHAEVVGFTRDLALLSPFSALTGISRSTRVMSLGRPLEIGVGDALLGRVVDSLGRPIDGGAPVVTTASRPVFASAPDAMKRRPIDAAMPTGVRAVDALMTLAEGQRMGIFAPAGVGKSTLMGMFARGTECDVNVIALIGERGREVREFVDEILGPDGMARSVVVCATSDRSSMERMKAAYAATAIAEHFRSEGRRVLLMMDSLTRFARAAREIALAAGEPPARRGFPPSIFAELPRLLERAGMGASDEPHGSITALYTVLAEDESAADPVAEEVRGILDGHMILSREIAARNQYPAIDVLGSLSRVMSRVVPPEYARAAARLRELMAKYREIEMLLQMGEYQPGSNPTADEAIDRHDAIRAFLSQPTDQRVDVNETWAHLFSVVASQA
ncbi:type III secretion system ATPase SctN [Paraburkholderia humisilvae]|uniref:Type 3 secretion system ATPase n=1 Tax=Paraburkholderia humisilvae TaxID=627669 RepID=A0A6J5ECJ7_9BURK|nr:type III secretion system ATPase SctN [Paraburkholderia humisilvae]CAB3764330.1 putative ATP synthase YscN [Paraburkholderia humisilvae]